VLFEGKEKKCKEDICHWYKGVPVGENIIGSFSKATGCDNVYTNHCTRNTLATALHEAGKSLHQVACITDHRNYKSLKAYLDQPNDEEKEDVSDTLFDYVV